MLGTAESELEMTLDEFRLIRDYILEKSGISFADNKMYLVKNRLAKRMSELQMKSVRDYFYHVKYDTSLREFNQLMDLVTTNETSFFRNEPQLLSFSDEVLPLMVNEKMKERGPKTIRIWSAGCSTGEEPYTLAIIIMEKLKSLTGWNVEIIANDISEQVLQKARQGEYSGITLRNLKPDLLERYFSRSGQTHRINADIKAMVKFSHMNLNDPRKIAMVGVMDAIFCRNVMIYFTEEVKRTLVRGFYNALNPGGYFYIGHSETLHGISKAFKLVYFKNALVYQKEVGVAGTSATPEKANLSLATPAAVRSAPGSGAGGALRAMDLLSRIKSANVK